VNDKNLALLRDRDDSYAAHHADELNRERRAMKTHEMIESKYLRKEDVGDGVLVTIVGIDKANLAMEGEAPKFRYCLRFEELAKPLVMNSTNIQLCEMACGSDESDDWIGHRIVLYNDPNVSMQGKLVGGIRIRKPRPRPAAAVVKPKAPVRPIPPQEEEVGVEDLDNDIPF
jgi:hypothetical protein